MSLSEQKRDTGPNHCKQRLTLLEGLKADAVLADKGYNADYIIDAMQGMGAIMIIP